MRFDTLWMLAVAANLLLLWAFVTYLVLVR